MKPPRFRFAPVSGSPSTAVRVASGWFIFNGAVYGLLVIVALAGIASGWGELRDRRIDWLGLVSSIVLTAGMVWTGMLIGRRKRVGGVLALVLILLQILSLLVSPRIDVFSLILMGLGVLVLISIWGELE